MKFKVTLHIKYKPSLSYLSSCLQKETRAGEMA